MARITLYSLGMIGKKMAGPGIRYWEFAKALSKTHEITLLTPNESDITSSDFVIKSHHNKKLTPDMLKTDVIIGQNIPAGQAIQARKSGTKIILDAYDPIPLEALEIYKSHTPKDQTIKNAIVLKQQILSFLTCDAVVCASEKQRDLWLGVLMSMNRLTPEIYHQDPTLRRLIDVVPFGLSFTTPVKTGPGLREKFGLKSSDKVIVWGGGIWNWFDPLSLIRAVHILSKTRQDIKLVFMGIKTACGAVPEMEMSQKALSLAKELELVDKHVFFNFDWIPYEERHNYLLDADIGASTHLEHLETRFSFRTRMLDYIWCELPILGTTGDTFGDLIQSHQLGAVVPYGNSEAIAEAIKKLIDDPKCISEIKSNLRKMKSSFHWDEVVKPLSTLTDKLCREPVKKEKFAHNLKIYSSYFSLIRSVYQGEGFGDIYFCGQVAKAVALKCLPARLRS